MFVIIDVESTFEPIIGSEVQSKELIDYLKIDQEDIIAFGDAEVDIPMFDFAGISVCVGNGREEAKEHATYVTKPVSEDGIKYALKHFEII